MGLVLIAIGAFFVILGGVALVQEGDPLIGFIFIALGAALSLLAGVFDRRRDRRR